LACAVSNGRLTLSPLCQHFHCALSEHGFDLRFGNQVFAAMDYLGKPDPQVNLKPASQRVAADTDSLCCRAQ
jgi:hypothetical protein